MPEDRLQRLEDALTVQAELVARFERSTEQRFIQVESEMAEFRAGLNAVLERMDRFIQGREGDGQK